MLCSPSLQRNSQELKSMCGHAGAANICGMYKGLQSRICSDTEKDSYEHCKEHCLNLSLLEASTSAVHCVTFFDLVEKLYAFCTGAMRLWWIGSSLCIPDSVFWGSRIYRVRDLQREREHWRPFRVLTTPVFQVGALASDQKAWIVPLPKRLLMACFTHCRQWGLWKSLRKYFGGALERAESLKIPITTIVPVQKRTWKVPVCFQHSPTVSNEWSVSLWKYTPGLMCTAHFWILWGD